MTTSAFLSIERSTVLRNTYALLSVSLLWSAAMSAVGTTIHFSGIGYLALVVIGFVALFAAMLLRDSPAGILMVFIFTGIEGLSLGPLFTHYLKMPHGALLIGLSAGLTGVLFMALSAYVLATRKNFDFLGGFLFVALVGLFLVGLVGLFVPTPLLQLALAFVGLLVFSGYVLYDTSRIVNGGETSYVVATISLYLNIMNVFLNILKILEIFSSSDD